MSNITRLPDAPSEVSVSCADLLRQALDVAEAGDMRAVAIVYVKRGHGIDSAFERGDAYASLLGGVTLLQHDVLHGGDVPGIDG